MTAVGGRLWWIRIVAMTKVAARLRPGCPHDLRPPNSLGLANSRRFGLPVR
jgi:hypothetical protein